MIGHVRLRHLGRLGDEAGLAHLPKEDVDFAVRTSKRLQTSMAHPDLRSGLSWRFPAFLFSWKGKKRLLDHAQRMTEERKVTDEKRGVFLSFACYLSAFS